MRGAVIVMTAGRVDNQVLNFSNLSRQSVGSQVAGWCSLLLWKVGHFNDD